jgi:hypothetical protein
LKNNTKYCPNQTIRNSKKPKNQSGTKRFHHVHENSIRKCSKNRKRNVSIIIENIVLIVNIKFVNNEPQFETLIFGLLSILFFHFCIKNEIEHQIGLGEHRKKFFRCSLDSFLFWGIFYGMKV